MVYILLDHLFPAGYPAPSMVPRQAIPPRPRTIPMNPLRTLASWWGRYALRCHLAFLLAWAILVCLPVHAEYCPQPPCDACGTCFNNCQEPPEFWVINTRCAPRCHNLDEGFQKIRFQRYDIQRHRFATENLESLLAVEPSIPTLLYVHGNHLDGLHAMESFWEVYHKLCHCHGPKRLVCWSWPAQRIFRGLRIRKMVMENLRMKEIYAEYQGYYLANLVRRWNPSQRIMFTGHSFGAIVVASATHLLGGGQLRCLTLTGGEPIERSHFRLGLISGAFDNDALLPGHRYGQTAMVVEKVLITRNPRDNVLAFWKRMSGRGCPSIGTTGLRANRLGPYRGKVCQLTTTEDVGRSHFIGTYLESKRLVSMLCRMAFSPPQDGGPSR